MSRFRLRFLLQEFDLVGPEVVLGRSPDCHITIEDPLISRRHARILVEGDRARIEDLGSRNGVRVNGRMIDGPTDLADNDRVRLGTQELVFLSVSREQRAARPTGYMRVCVDCSTPYPEQAQRCPHCGSTEARDDDTISGLVVEPPRNWTFQLIGEVIDRALSTGRAAEAERLMRRTAKEIEDRLGTGERLDPADVATLGTYALRLAKLLGGSEWVQWALDVHTASGTMLSAAVIDRLEDLGVEGVPEMPSLVQRFTESWRAKHDSNAPNPDLAGLARLERLSR